MSLSLMCVYQATNEIETNDDAGTDDETGNTEYNSDFHFTLKSFSF